MKNGRRVFLDTSVIIAALLSPTGGSAYILHNYHKDFHFLINEYVLKEELSTFKTKFPKDKTLHDNFLLLLGFSSVEILPNPAIESIRKLDRLIEKGDTPILAGALEHADWLLTLDNHFLASAVLEHALAFNLQILKPKDFIQLHPRHLK